MKVTICIEDIGPPKSGRIRLTINPRVHIMRKMAQNKDAPPSIAYAGLVIKKVYEVMPHGDAIKLEGDDKTVFEDATARQARKANIREDVLGGRKKFTKRDSGLIIPE